ncbi:XVIPCD domain-containing protein [Lysobacter firmicutimachus]|uniref:XVIPCD domain-containing protein n=1 Tax=Lysobacter firmicutimachus TaxID=1792846 RepID=A0AAU8MPB1_9GAMM
MSEQSPHGNVGPSKNEPSFADQVRGLDAKPIDKTMARLMDDLYELGPGADGFKPLSADQLLKAGIDPASLENPDSGFRARIYGDDQGRYVLAYSGTDEGKDWLTNFRQGLGFEDAQYNQAIALAREAKIAFGDQVAITGHSLGGGLAGAASISTGIPAVTFNASGVHDKTLERIGIDADAAKQEVAHNGQIRRFAVKNEILTDLQEHSIPLKWAMPDAVGHKIELPDPDPQSFWRRMIPGNGIKHGIDVHYIEAVIKAQEMAYPERRAAALDAPSAPVRTASDTDWAQPGHSHRAMYDQALRGLQGLDGKGLEFRGEQGVRNAAAHAALDARANGLERIDHVVPGRDGGGFFVVQGALEDPSHRRVFLDQARALSTPPAAPLAAPSEQTAAQQSETRRAVMS